MFLTVCILRHLSDIALLLIFSVSAMRSAGLQPTGCCPTRRCVRLWESCADPAWGAWLRCSRTSRSLSTATFPTSLGAQVRVTRGRLPRSVTCQRVCVRVLSALVVCVCSCVCCSAWSRWPAGVWDTKGEAVCLHAGQVPSVRGLPHPEGEHILKPFRTLSLVQERKSRRGPRAARNKQRSGRKHIPVTSHMISLNITQSHLSCCHNPLLYFKFQDV